MQKILMSAMVVGWALAASAQQYTVREITLPHANNGMAHAMNASGTIAGGVGRAHGGDISGFIATANGARVIARPAGSDYLEATALNDSGSAVGMFNTDGAERGFVSGSTGFLNLAPAPGDTASAAFGISEDGTVVGFSSGAKGERAVAWSAGAKQPSVLPLPSGSDESSARGRNANGTTVGWCGARSSARQACVWDKSGARLLGTLPGANSSEAVAINAPGAIAGISGDGSVEHAFIFTFAGGLKDLGTLSGGNHSEAAAINDAGSVVGSSGSGVGMRAFVWSEADGMRDLNQLVPGSANLVLQAAVAINNAGQILAVGSKGHDLTHDREAKLDADHHSGTMQVFLLTPVGR